MGRIWWCAQPVISRRCPIYDTSDREVVRAAEGCGRAVVYTALLITPPAGGDVQEITVFAQGAINAILRDPCVDCLTSSDGAIDFWFRSAVPGRYRPNRQATGLLLSVTTFSVRTVPLLYGSVIVSSKKSSEGRLLGGLTTQDRRRLRDPGRLGRMWLHRRFHHAPATGHRPLAINTTSSAKRYGEIRARPTFSRQGQAERHQVSYPEIVDVSRLVSDSDDFMRSTGLPGGVTNLWPLPLPVRRGGKRKCGRCRASQGSCPVKPQIVRSKSNESHTSAAYLSFSLPVLMAVTVGYFFCAGRSHECSSITCPQTHNDPDNGHCHRDR